MSAGRMMTNQRTTELAELSQKLRALRFNEVRADVVGRELGARLLEWIPAGCNRRAIAVAALLDRLCQDEPDPDCQAQLLQWSREHYWGIEVQRCLAVFDDCHSFLVEHDHTRDNRLWWGDADCSAWHEANPNAATVIIVAHSSAADDNTWLYLQPHG